MAKTHGLMGSYGGLMAFNGGLIGSNGHLLGGIPTPLKKYEFVSWDYSSQYMENQINVPNHQAVRDLTVVTTLTLKALQR